MDYTLKSIRGKNIRTVKALLLSLLLHILIVLLFIVTFKEVVFPPIKVAEQSISINLKQFVPPVPQPVVVPPQPVLLPPVVEEIPEPEQQVEQVVVKKKLLDEKKRLVVDEKSSEENNVTKVLPKVEKKTVQKKVEKKPRKVVKKKIVKKKKTKKKVVKRQKQKRQKQKKSRRSKDPLAQMLMDASTSMKPQRRASSPSIKMVRQFYGKEFDTFTSTQKKFIEKNLGAIHRITQATLSRNGYPDVALRTRQKGTAIVSFYLHPNGAISGLRLKKRIGYASLDDNTLKVIRIAYKDYPRPTTKTKITFYVEYSLY